MYNPTPQQQDILDCYENCVVIAGPGSGKTSTISHKICSVVKSLRWYEGISAISYTNKASGELKAKTITLCQDLKKFLLWYNRFFLYRKYNYSVWQKIFLEHLIRN